MLKERVTALLCLERIDTSRKLGVGSFAGHRDAGVEWHCGDVTARTA
jgi:hypothetical protein